MHLPRSIWLPPDSIGVLKRGVSNGKGVFLGNPKDSGQEDWGTLGNIRGITTPQLKNPIVI